MEQGHPVPVEDDELALHLKFTDGKLDFFVGHPQPNIDFIFKTLADARPPANRRAQDQGLVTNAGTLVKFLPLMLGLTLLLPNKLPQDRRRLKVNCCFYFTLPSQLNKHGDEDMVNFCKDMPDRVFQWSVQPNGRLPPCASLVPKGKVLPRRRFVHMMFRDVDSAFAVLTTQL